MISWLGPVKKEHVSVEVLRLRKYVIELEKALCKDFDDVYSAIEDAKTEAMDEAHDLRGDVESLSSDVDSLRNQVDSLEDGEEDS
jgi:polyhydroxyalkanoate synthesis regulator phasin